MKNPHAMENQFKKMATLAETFIRFKMLEDEQWETVSKWVRMMHGTYCVDDAPKTDFFCVQGDYMDMEMRADFVCKQLVNATKCHVQLSADMARSPFALVFVWLATGHANLSVHNLAPDVDFGIEDIKLAFIDYSSIRRS
jgi:hypothetical protein